MDFLVEGVFKARRSKGEMNQRERDQLKGRSFKWLRAIQAATTLRPDPPTLSSRR